ncbi:Aste57867_7676 [Aphanomyces stellatus]|uniref:Aste57867_7676 protein n=1 Tax=Aphanomyces stellatus TaxID=120398 RepID=A0A485KIM2_9STRA|nr:hypothetical protein As57867_007648 [Aphanomyces stellatus]VFT84579.1 Aste57867_7676 [Aphanomyces stellatus]
MPKYQGRMDESISLYIHQVTTFFKAKNVDFQADDGTHIRCIAMTVANFRGLAAAWYQERLHSREVPSTLLELENELRDEFEPDDLQDRLRDQLYELKQAHCASLTEYVAKFGRICTQICDMTERDKVSWFQRGLRTRTREELQYRPCLWGIDITEIVTATIVMTTVLSMDTTTAATHTVTNTATKEADLSTLHQPASAKKMTWRSTMPKFSPAANVMLDLVSTAAEWAIVLVNAVHHARTTKEDPKNINSETIRRHNQPSRIQRNTPSRQHNAQVNEVGSESDGSEDDVEEMILGNNMNLAEHSEVDFVFHRTATGLIDAPADWVTAVTPLVVVNADSMESMLAKMPSRPPRQRTS